MPGNSSSWNGWWRRASSAIQSHSRGSTETRASESAHGSRNGWRIAYVFARTGQQRELGRRRGVEREVDLQLGVGGVVAAAEVQRLDGVAHRLGVEEVHEQAHSVPAHGITPGSGVPRQARQRRVLRGEPCSRSQALASTSMLLAPVHELGDKPAVSVGDDALTYRELREAAGALAARFEGVERVAVWAESTLETSSRRSRCSRAASPLVPVNPKLGRSRARARADGQRART